MMTAVGLIPALFDSGPVLFFIKFPPVLLTISIVFLSIPFIASVPSQVFILQIHFVTRHGKISVLAYERGSDNLRQRTHQL